MQQQLERDLSKLQDNFGKAFSNVLVTADKVSKG